MVLVPLAAFVHKSSLCGTFTQETTSITQNALVDKSNREYKYNKMLGSGVWNPMS
jgi:hypothetical protein